MVSVLSLWLPILVSAVLVFVASSIIHMFLTYHSRDFGKLKAEDEVLDVLRPFEIATGDYMVPCAKNLKEAGTEAFIAKMNRGPVAVMTILPNGPRAMGSQLGQWFVYGIVVAVVTGYATGLALGPGAEYREVFRISSTVAFAGYALALPQGSIWYGRNWGYTLRTMCDGLVFALLTGGAFGWLWP